MDYGVKQLDSASLRGHELRPTNPGSSTSEPRKKEKKIALAH